VARWLRPSPDIQLSVLAFDFPSGAPSDAEARHEQGWRGTLPQLEALRYTEEHSEGV